MSSNPNIIMERGDKIQLSIDYGTQGKEEVLYLTSVPVWDAFKRAFVLRAESEERHNQCKSCDGTGMIAMESVTDNLDVTTTICDECKGSGQRPGVGPAPETSRYSYKESNFVERERSPFQRRLNMARRLEDDRTVESLQKQLGKLSDESKLRIIAKHDVALYRMAQDIERVQRAFENNRGIAGKLVKEMMDIEDRLKEKTKAGEEILAMLDTINNLMNQRAIARQELLKKVEELRTEFDALSNSIRKRKRSKK